MKEALSVSAADCFANGTPFVPMRPWGYTRVLDARTPGEFAEDHLPGAVNWPVLDDAQRASVGTLHRQEGAFTARRAGAALVARNIANLLDAYATALEPQAQLLVYCWRGGQRSASLATVLARIGYRVAVLEGGYKSFRRHVLEQLPQLITALRLQVVAGRTGSGKTAVLGQLSELGEQVLDLEGLACHRGSVLGAEPSQPQPSQRAFETRLWLALRTLQPERPVWLEAESKRIGLCTLPDRLIEAMHRSPAVVLQVPQQARTDFLLEQYPFWVEHKAELAKALQRLQPRVGAQVHELMQSMLEVDDMRGVVQKLLEHHYDPLYDRSLARNYPDRPLKVLNLERLDQESLQQVAQELRTATCAAWPTPSMVIESTLGTEPVRKGLDLRLAPKSAQESIGHRIAVE